MNMTPEEAVSAVHQGMPVECTREDWPAILRALQEAAARWIDQGEHLRAGIALQEAKIGNERFGIGQ